MKRLMLFVSVCCWMLAMQAAVHNVKDYGAKADGVTIDSPAINRAISAAAAEGGGTVYVPAGEYACYSIRLASHIHIYLEQGARIIAASPTPDAGYDEAEPNEHNRYQDFGHSHWKNSLIWGIGIEEVT
ncbi:MAG: glycoside hydrolase family 28 protein, partial [Bacteroides sp.]|nr:glycoside hydrolase family 28 protein [Bacteroides sp.]